MKWTKLFRNQGLGTGCSCCYLDVIDSRPSQWTEQENIGVYNHMHLHMYKYLHLCICISKTMIYTNSCHYSIFILPFFSSKKTGHYLQHIYLFAQFPSCGTNLLVTKMASAVAPLGLPAVPAEAPCPGMTQCHHSTCHQPTV